MGVIVKNFLDHLIFVRKAHIPNFIPLVPFLHVKKFVVVGGWVGVKVDFSVKLRPKLNNSSFVTLGLGELWFSWACDNMTFVKINFRDILFYALD